MKERRAWNTVMVGKVFVVTTLVAFSLLLSALAQAVPTRLVVRAKANDAKFIGTPVGGLKAVVRDAVSGRILAEKMIVGGTGDTKVLMKMPRSRNTLLSAGGAAKAEFVFDIEEPVKLQVEVIGPLGAGDDIHRESKTTWLIPGKDITGDGLMFNLYGLIVHADSPSPHQFYPAGAKVVIGVHVTPMCGCPISPSSLWNSKDVNVEASVFHGNEEVARIPLVWAGDVSRFQGVFTPTKAGGYKVVVTASDSRNNQGAEVTGFVVVPTEVYQRLRSR